MKSEKFVADAYVSREYRSAVVLEEVLQEINDLNAINFAKTTLNKFNRHIKDLKNVSAKEYFGSFLMKQYQNQILNATQVPLKVRTLLLNVVKTKYKIEILKNEN
jgi:hypothetical protein